MQPANASELFTEALPRWLSQALVRLGDVPLAPVPVTVRVVGEGEWTLCVRDGRLEVADGMSDDCALQVSLRLPDFEVLVLQRLRGAEGMLRDAAPHSGAWRRRLQRLDAETADLLRRVEGTLLVRFQDGESLRPVAITPGAQPFSLQSATCTVDCDLKSLAGSGGAGEQSPFDLLSSGAVRLSGDAQVALALAGLFL